jgi:hypothetical protein
MLPQWLADDAYHPADGEYPAPQVDSILLNALYHKNAAVMQQLVDTWPLADSMRERYLQVLHVMRDAEHIALFERIIGTPQGVGRIEGVPSAEAMAHPTTVALLGTLHAADFLIVRNSDYATYKAAMQIVGGGDQRLRWSHRNQTLDTAYMQHNEDFHYSSRRVLYLIRDPDCDPSTTFREGEWQPLLRNYTKLRTGLMRDSIHSRKWSKVMLIDLLGLRASKCVPRDIPHHALSSVIKAALDVRDLAQCALGVSEYQNFVKQLHYYAMLPDRLECVAAPVRAWLNTGVGRVLF